MGEDAYKEWQGAEGDKDVLRGVAKHLRNAAAAGDHQGHDRECGCQKGNESSLSIPDKNCGCYYRKDLEDGQNDDQRAL